MHEWLQLAIGLVILGAVFWTVHRHGRGNPQSTGQIARQVNKLFAELRRMEGKVDEAATKEALAALAAELRQLEKRAASSGEVIALEGKINVLRSETETLRRELAARLEGMERQAERTYAAVDRIEGVLVRQALERGGDAR